MRHITCKKDGTGETYLFLFNGNEDRPEVPEGFTFIEEGEEPGSDVSTDIEREAYETVYTDTVVQHDIEG